VLTGGQMDLAEHGTAFFGALFFFLHGIGVLYRHDLGKILDFSLLRPKPGQHNGLRI
jgi:hypothetical protein